MRFSIEEVPAFYQGYIKQVTGSELIEALQVSGEQVVGLCEELTEAQSLFRYAEGKWSVKDLIQHLIDAERVFSYRAMRFARNDQTELSGFNQDDYVKEVVADKFALQDLITSFKNMRQSTIDMFLSFSETELMRSGKSNGVKMSVEMIGFVIAGHTLHHKNIIQSRYL